MHCVALLLLLLLLLLISVNARDVHQALSQISLHNSRIRIDPAASVRASPRILGAKKQGSNVDYVRVKFSRPLAGLSDFGGDDWIAVFSPASLSSQLCPNETNVPKLCTAPIKFQYANFSGTSYASTGRGSLRLRLINQRQDFSFGLFSGGLDKPVLLAVSNVISFANPKAPAFPRLALGSSWNEITVTWTSGYNVDEAEPFVSLQRSSSDEAYLAPATTLTFGRSDMCGPPAKTVGWRDPGFIHTSYLQNLWPNAEYTYQVGHKLKDGSYVYGTPNHFTAPPSPGQESLQRVMIFGDMGKGERDLSNDYQNYQPAALNTTDRLLEDLGNYDLVFHIGDIVYSNGFLSQWDQFTEQVGGIAGRVPYMIASGNHERDFPASGSYFNGTDSGGECGVPCQTMFSMPAKNRVKLWYSATYGMFHFCVADSETDWREGTEQHRFLERCLASVDRQKQPWLIFIAHRVLGYSSSSSYAADGSFSEPAARENLQQLWQKYKVDVAFYGHVHSYERSCPVYQSKCLSDEEKHYSGRFNATIHVVAGGGGAHLAPFAASQPAWSLLRDLDFGFVKLTAFNRSSLLFEYKKSSNSGVHDSFRISREYMDVLGCDAGGVFCPSVVT